jgi:tight adherence protein B
VDMIFYGFAILLFAAVIFLIEGAYLWWSSTRGESAKRIERRLRMMSSTQHNSEQLSMIKQRLLSESPGVERLLLQVPRIKTADRILEQSGIGWSMAKLITYTLATFLLTALLATFLRLPWFVPVLLGLLCSVMPWLLVLRARSNRLIKLELQLPEAADLISRGLRAGHAFPSTLQMVGEEMPEPISGEFRIAFDEINYGVGMNDALQNLATRIPLTDLRYLVIAVLIQRESGGNLAEIMDNLSQIIRARLKLLGQVRVLAAEGKMSAWILGLLPFAVGLVISITNPKFLSVLWTDPAGIKLIWAAVGMMLLGLFWMRKIIRIHV